MLRLDTLYNQSMYSYFELTEKSVLWPMGPRGVTLTQTFKDQMVPVHEPMLVINDSDWFSMIMNSIHRKSTRSKDALNKSDMIFENDEYLIYQTPIRIP